MPSKFAMERPAVLTPVLDAAKDVFRLGAGSLHGPGHWLKVEKNVVKLCAKEQGADLMVCRLFAIIHDCQRQDEYGDPNHGERAAEWFEANLYQWPALSGLTAEQIQKLLEATRRHNYGGLSEDPTIGVCWDADRLELPRVGVRVNPMYLSTETARKLIEREER